MNLNSEKLLTDKTAVITGGSGRRGIGFATARMFARHGCHCVVLDLESANPEQAAAEISAEFGGAHVGIVCDVRDAAMSASAIAHAAEPLGRLDILINNAGFSQPLKTEEIGDADYEAMMDVHVRACLRMSSAVLPYMRRANGGAIVNMSSISAIRGGGIFGGPHYSAAKAGIIGITRAMAREFASENIRINAVAPSLIQTDIYGDNITEDRMAKIIAEIPMGRLGKPDDVAGVLLFLASDLASYVTGEVIKITGGSHIG